MELGWCHGEDQPLLNWLDGSGLGNELATPAGRADFFAGMSYEGFDQFVLDINDKVLDEDHPGYVPAGERPIEYDHPTLGPSHEDQGVLYLSPSDRVRREVAPEAFAAAQEMENVDDALTVLGMVYTGLQRMRDDNSLTMVVARQLLSPRGRGYSGTPEDRRYYTDLTQNAELYDAQDLHPLTKGLISRYALVNAPYIAQQLGYTGPLAGTERGTWAEVYTELYRRRWPEPSAREVSAIVNERTFCTMSILQYLYTRGRNPAAYLVRKEGQVLLSLAGITDMLHSDSERQAAPGMADAHDSQKKGLLQSIVGCIAQGQQHIFGPPGAILDAYRLPTV